MMLARRVLNRLVRPFGVNPFPRAFPNPIAERSGSAAAVWSREQIVQAATRWSSL